MLVGGPLGQQEPPACCQCSGSQRRHTAARKCEAGGSAGRRRRPPAGSCSAAQNTPSNTQTATKPFPLFENVSSEELSVKCVLAPYLFTKSLVQRKKEEKKPLTTHSAKQDQEC